jgi:hypothetical protein
MKIFYYYTICLLGVLVISPVILFLLPNDFFDHGQSLCLSKILINKECYACGMTRAIMHLIHGDVENAFAYNMLSFLVLPLLVVIWVMWIIKVFRKASVLAKAKRS